mgnify:CR=1 FL=1
MKKSLIALAVLGFAGAAMAQSSVTLYGVADAGVARIQAYDENGDKRSLTAFSSAGLMNNADSRVGLRGVEDLGGGLKVGFNFETGLSLGTGASTGNAFWQRQAHLWIGGNWGTVKLGRAFTPSFLGVDAWELTGVANYSVVAATYGVGGFGTPFRNSSQISYKTPNLGGFSAEVGYILKNNGLWDNDLAGAKWDVNAIYANGPISAGLSVNKAKSEKTNYAIGGKYDFGMFAVAAGYHSGDLYDALWIDHIRRRGFSLGGSTDLGPFALTLDFTRDTRNSAGKKYTNALLEGKYALSRRTFVYAAYLRLDGDNNYGMGLQHSF